MIDNWIPLIIGANSQLAQDFIRYFDIKGSNYIATSRDHVNSLDITKVDDIRLYFEKYEFDYVINCSAYNNVDGAEDDFESAIAINHHGVRNLVEACKKYNKIIIHYSTDAVFDGKKKIPYIETDEPKPLSKYAESKLLGEEEIIKQATNYYIIRVSWLFGSLKHGLPDNFVRKAIGWSKLHRVLKIVDDKIASPTYTKDLVLGTIALLKKRPSSGIYHITNSGECSKYELTKQIMKLIRWNGEIEPVSSSSFHELAQRPDYSTLDNGLFMNITNYSLPHWKDALGQYIEDLEQNKII